MPQLVRTVWAKKCLLVVDRTAKHYESHTSEENISMLRVSTRKCNLIRSSSCVKCSVATWKCRPWSSSALSEEISIVGFDFNAAINLKDPEWLSKETKKSSSAKYGVGCNVLAAWQAEQIGELFASEKRDGCQSEAVIEDVSFSYLFDTWSSAEESSCHT